MDVSIIIVNYNTKELTLSCLKSVLEQTRDIEFDIYVIDNASVDGSPQVIRNEFPQVKLIENKENLGFGRANNIAIKDSQAKYVFLLNSDTVLINNAPKIFFDFMELEKSRDVACCGGNLYNPDMSAQPSFGNFPSIKQILFEFGLSKIFKRYFYNHLSEGASNYDNFTKEVAHIIGADMFIRKEALNRIGPFDEDFFLYYEETELCYRMHLAGYKMMLVPEAKIIHFYSQSSAGIPSYKKIMLHEKSKYLYFKKCHGNRYANLAKLLYLLKYSFLVFLNHKNITKDHIKVTLDLIRQ
jgi:GT2 family glycosyltransferase